jgi:predicted AAA+ superfamily ATPase
LVIQRALNLKEVLGERGSALLLGARGVGKTQLARAWLVQRPSAISIDLLKFDSYTR